MKTTTVKCCGRHKENVQLIWTFAFPGAEYWCPYCGYMCGMLGAGEERELTFTEMRGMIKYRHIGKEYLDAKATFNSTGTRWEGEMISPEDLPDEEKQRLQKIIDDWVYPIDREND